MSWRRLHLLFDTWPSIDGILVLLFSFSFGSIPVRLLGCLNAWEEGTACEFIYFKRVEGLFLMLVLSGNIFSPSFQYIPRSAQMGFHNVRETLKELPGMVRATVYVHIAAP